MLAFKTIDVLISEFCQGTSVDVISDEEASSRSCSESASTRASDRVADEGKILLGVQIITASSFTHS